MQIFAHSNIEIPTPRKDPDLERRILREQVKLIYQQGPTLSLGAAAAAVLMTYYSTRTNPGGLPVAWLLVVMASVFFRLWMFFRFSRARGTDETNEMDYRQWGWRFAFGSTLAGIVWSSWPFLFYADHSAEYLLMITAVVAGMVAVLASSGSVYLPAFYCFAVPLCLPFILFHTLSGVDVLIWTGWLLLMFFFVNLVLALKGNRNYNELIEARFRNMDLMEQLAEKKTIAETAVAEKNNFIAAASHDLRQPLHALSLFLAALGKSDLNQRQRSIVADMRKSTGALNNHFSSILDISKLESDSIVVTTASVELDQVIDLLESDFRADARQKGLYLQVDDCFIGATVDTDALILERVIRNIVGNAIRLTDTGGVALSVKQTEQHAVLSIADTGPGIAEDELPLIFNDYYRGNVSASSGGLGLGLSIVKRFCARLDIDMEVKSTPGIGTVFYIKIPLGEKQKVNRRQALSGLPAPDSQSLGPDNRPKRQPDGRTILVIDDEPDILAACAMLLESMDWRPVVALSLREALTTLTRDQIVPDIVLCDYRLADGANGIETIAALREWFGRELPACVVTGDTSPDRLADISASGLPVLYKPVELEQLEGRLVELQEADEANGDKRSNQYSRSVSPPVHTATGKTGKHSASYSFNSRDANATSL